MGGMWSSKKKRIARAVSVMMLGAWLTGCAGPQVPATCPERQPIPVALTEPSLPSAEAFSQKVSDFFRRLEKAGEKRPESATP